MSNHTVNAGVWYSQGMGKSDLLHHWLLNYFREQDAKCQNVEIETHGAALIEGRGLEHINTLEVPPRTPSEVSYWCFYIRKCFLSSKYVPVTERSHISSTDVKPLFKGLKHDYVEYCVGAECVKIFRQEELGSNPILTYISHTILGKWLEISYSDVICYRG